MFANLKVETTAKRQLSYTFRSAIKCFTAINFCNRD